MNGRSSHWRCSVKKDVLENFTKFTRKHLYQSLFLNKVAGLPVFSPNTGKPATLLKKRLGQRGFPVNFVKFLRTPFLQNTSGRLLLEWIDSKRDNFGNLCLIMLNYLDYDHDFPICHLGDSLISCNKVNAIPS